LNHTEPRTHEHANSKYDKVVSACFFEPVVAFRFWKAGKAVDVLVCFHCGELGFQVVGEPKAIGGTLSFGPARARLLALVTAARPNDARLRGIR